MRFIEHQLMSVLLDLFETTKDSIVIEIIIAFKKE